MLWFERGECFDCQGAKMRSALYLVTFADIGKVGSRLSVFLLCKAGLLVLGTGGRG